MDRPYSATTPLVKSKGYKNPTSETDVEQLEPVMRKLNLSPKPKVERLSGIANRTKMLVKLSKESLGKDMQFALMPLVKTTQYGIDARKLFGDTSLHSNTVVLRTSEQSKQGSAIELPQFDPNFFSHDQIHCRYSGCSETKARNRKVNQKEDLYLCSRHRHDMVELVSKKCAEKEITVNFKDFENEDLNDYTSLIGLMEKSFQRFEKKASQDPPSSSTLDCSLAEIYLNVRNFFMITNAVLNPDYENLRCAFPPVYNLLRLLLENLNNLEFVNNIRELFRDVMNAIFTFFGVIYNWVMVVVRQNAGAEVGAGVGMAGGAILAGVAFGPAVVMIALGAGIGVLSGGLIGGGIFKLLQGNSHQQHNVFQFNGYPDGGLTMVICNFRFQ